MADNQQYAVNYQITVNSEAATTNLSQFASAVDALGAADVKLESLATALKNLNTSFGTGPTGFSQKLISLQRSMANLRKMANLTLTIETGEAMQYLDNVERKLVRIQTLTRGLNVGGVPTPQMTASQIRQARAKLPSQAALTQAAMLSQQRTGLANPPFSLVNTGGFSSLRGWNGKSTLRTGRIIRNGRYEGAELIRGLEYTNAQYDAAMQQQAMMASMYGMRPTPSFAGKGRRAAGRYRTTRVSPAMARLNRAAANALGHAEIVEPMAVGMLKGMGMSYGLMAVMGAMGGVVRDATEYNNMMQTAKNILGAHDKGGDFEARFKDMERVVRNIGVETKFTAPEVADAARYLAMAGMNVGAIKSSMPSVANLALIGDTDLGTTADVVTNIMTAYGIAPSMMGRAGDVMTNTFTETNTTLMEIAESYKYAASLLSTAGVDFETATAAIGILGDAGIKSSQAGTTLRTILNNIAKPTKPQEKAWKKLGIERFETDAYGRQKLRPLNEIFGELAAKELPVESYYRLFRLTAAQGAAALTTHVDKWNKVIEDNFLSDGMMDKLAEAKKGTIQGLWAQLTSSFTEGGIKAFENLQERIEGVLKSATVWTKGPEGSSVIENLADRIWQIGEALVGVTKTIGGLLKVFGGAFTGFIKMELILGSIAIAARSIKSVLNVGGMIAGWGRSLYTAAGIPGVISNKLSYSQWTAPMMAPLFYKKYGNGVEMTGAQRQLALIRMSKDPLRNSDPAKAYQNAQKRVLRPLNYKSGNGTPYLGWNLSKEPASSVWRYTGLARNESYSGYSAFPSVIKYPRYSKLDAQKELDKARGMWWQGVKEPLGAAFSSMGSIAAAGVFGALGSRLGGEDNPGLNLLGSIGGGAIGLGLPSIMTALGASAVASGGITLAVAAVAGLAMAFADAKKRANEAGMALADFAKKTQVLHGIVMDTDKNPQAEYMALVANTTLNATQKLEQYIAIRNKQLGIDNNVPKSVPGTFADTLPEQLSNYQAIWKHPGEEWMDYYMNATHNSLDDLVAWFNERHVDRYINPRFKDSEKIVQLNRKLDVAEKRRFVEQAGIALVADARSGDDITQLRGMMRDAKSSADIDKINNLIRQKMASYQPADGYVDYTRKQYKNGDFVAANTPQYVAQATQNLLDFQTGELAVHANMIDSMGVATVSRYLAQYMPIMKYDNVGTQAWVKKVYDPDLFPEDTAIKQWDKFFSHAMDLAGEISPDMRARAYDAVYSIFKNTPATQAKPPKDGESMQIDDILYQWNATDQRWHAKTFQPASTASEQLKVNPALQTRSLGEAYMSKTASNSGNISMPQDLSSDYGSDYSSTAGMVSQTNVTIGGLINADSIDLANPGSEMVVAELRDKLEPMLKMVLADAIAQAGEGIGMPGMSVNMYDTMNS